MLRPMMQDATLPWLRIEACRDSIKFPHQFPASGFAVLIMGKTIVDEVLMIPDEFKRLCRQAEAIRKEIGMLRVDATATMMSVMIPVTATPVVLWPERK